MKKNIKLSLFLALFSTMIIYSQEVYSCSDVCRINDLTYNTKTDKIFSGVVQINRKNGSLSGELEYVNGVVLVKKYYSRKNPNIPWFEIEYDPQNPSNKLKQISRYSDIEETKYFDKNKKKKLLERRKQGKLIYTRKYKNGKKIES